MVNHIESGGRGGFDTLLNPSKKWLARVHHVVVFKTKFCISRLKIRPIKDTNEKRKFKRMLSFLFVGKRELFAMKLQFRGIQACFLHGGSERLACFRTGVRKYRFCSQLLNRTSIGQARAQCYNDFLSCFSRFNLRERIHDPVSVTQIHFYDYLWVLE